MQSQLDAYDVKTISEEVALIAALEERSTAFLRQVEQDRRKRSQRAREARGDMVADWVI